MEELRSVRVSVAGGRPAVPVPVPAVPTDVSLDRAVLIVDSAERAVRKAVRRSRYTLRMLCSEDRALRRSSKRFRTRFSARLCGLVGFRTGASFRGVRGVALSGRTLTVLAEDAVWPSGRGEAAPSRVCWDSVRLGLGGPPSAGAFSEANEY